MKKVLFIVGGILLFVSIAIVAGVVFFGETSSKGLVLDMPLDNESFNSATNRTTDKTPYENHGTATNFPGTMTFTTDRNSQSARALSFDGTDDQVDIPNVLNPGTTPFSAMMWVNLDAEVAGVSQVILQQDGTSGRTWLYRDPTENDLRSYFGNAATDSVGTISTNQWYHVAITFDGSTLQLYLDGVADGSATRTEESETGDMIIGRHKSPDDDREEWSGAMSDVKIYNRALSATEITALYDSYKSKTTAGSLQKGLVGHWTLDNVSFNSATNRTTDKTPYENHGTVVEAVGVTDRNEQGGGAMNFDGDTDYVQVSDSNSLDATSGVTISTWVKLDTISGDQKIVKKTGAYILAIGDAGPGTDELELIIFDGATGRLQNREAAGATQLQAEQWYHMVGTYDGSDINTYIDGVLDRSGSYSGDIDSTSNNLLIGINNDLSTKEVNGSMSDVRIYDRALSPDEINTIYNSYRPKITAGSLQKGLVLDMPLKSKYTKTETAGSEVMTDRTPYSNDGTNYGANVGTNWTNFDGVDDRINRTDAASLRPADEVTVSVWIKTSALNSVAQSIFVGKAVWNDEGYSLFDNGQWTSEIIWRIMTLNSGNTYDVKFARNLVNDGEWHHIVGKHDGSTSYIYLDGILQQSKGSTDMVASTTTFTIGSFRGSSGISLMSDVKIYDRALSATEITSLYDRGR